MLEILGNIIAAIGSLALAITIFMVILLVMIGAWVFWIGSSFG